MSNIQVLELKKIVINYLQKNESEDIYGNSKLQDILKKTSTTKNAKDEDEDEDETLSVDGDWKDLSNVPIFSFFKSKPAKKSKKRLKGFKGFIWNIEIKMKDPDDPDERSYQKTRINMTSVLSEKSKDVYCMLGNEIGFIDDKFFFLKGMRKGWNSKSLFDLEKFVNIYLEPPLKYYGAEWRKPMWDHGPWHYPKFGLPGYSVYERNEDTDDLYNFLRPGFSICNDSTKALMHLNEIQKLFSSYISKKNNEALEVRRNVIVSEISSDEGGSIEIISSTDFDNLLKQHQSQIISIDRTYIQKFVKASKFLKTKKDNLDKMFLAVKQVGDISNLEEFYKLIKEEKYVYDLVLFHSLSMVVSLVEDDMITFYEIYELFDEFNIFNSNWENETTQKLSEMNLGIDGIRKDIKQMDTNICNGLIEILRQSIKMESNVLGAIENLTYVTGSGFNNLNASITTKLSSINSTLKLSNLLSGIQIYQNHRTNRLK